jgi:hypothetical protein
MFSILRKRGKNTMNELEILDFEKNDDGNIQYTFRNQNTGEMVIMVGDDIFNDEIGDYNDSSKNQIVKRKC